MSFELPKGAGYDLPTTLLFSTFFIFFAWIGYELFKKFKIKIDSKLVFCIIPWILFSSCLRVLEDLEVVKSFLFVTPGIWIFVTLFVASIFFLSKAAKVPYFKLLYLVGLINFSITFFFYRPKSFLPFFPLFLFSTPLLIFFFVKWKKENSTLFSLHTFDGIVSYVSIEFFKYKHKHVFPTLLINFLGPISYLVAKIVATFIFIALVDLFVKERELNKYLKLVAGIVGGITAFRDLLLLLAYPGYL